MKKVTGIGGVFFKAKDPELIKKWYGDHLGLTTDQYGSAFEWRISDNKEAKGFTQWSPFKDNTDYFRPSEKDFMINFRVADIEILVVQLKEEGITILDEIEEFEYGKFVHILDPENNKIELWQPKDVEFEKVALAITK